MVSWREKYTMPEVLEEFEISNPYLRDADYLNRRFQQDGRKGIEHPRREYQKIHAAQKFAWVSHVTMPMDLRPPLPRLELGL